MCVCGWVPTHAYLYFKNKLASLKGPTYAWHREWLSSHKNLSHAVVSAPHPTPPHPTLQKKKKVVCGGGGVESMTFTPKCVKKTGALKRREKGFALLRRKIIFLYKKIQKTE